MEQVKKWFFEKMNEFILFLEYPLDYIEEFGDELKRLSSGERVLKIGKALISIYLCILLIEFILFAVLFFAFLGGPSSGENAYTRALKHSKIDAETKARTGQGSWKDVADIDQEIRNNEYRGGDYED